jgi:hypothetical protein
MRAQRIERNNSTKAPQIIDERQPTIPEPPKVDPAVAHIPVRTVFLMEVGDMAPEQIQYLVQEINKVYSESKGGVHYVLPVRHGKIGSDLLFEVEWERVVQDTCEIRDGQIKLKEGAQDCQIVRQNI